ncbi:MAG TPA: hypothetical protein VES39_06610, partial [Rhodospirillales bacterium]|nr:hypothetical protein [Rhodospirillales bacterium]
MTAPESRSRAAAGQSNPVDLDVGGVRTSVQVRRHPRARRASLRLAADGDGVIVVLPPRARLEDALRI